MSILGSTSGPESGHVRAILVIGGLLGSAILLGMFTYAWLFNGVEAAKEPAIAGFGFLPGVVVSAMQFYFGARTAEQSAATATAHAAAAMQATPPSVAQSPALLRTNLDGTARRRAPTPYEELLV